MDNYNSPGVLTSPPCAGCGAGEVTSMQDIGSYSYMNPIQKQQPNQQSNQIDNQMLSGLPGQQPAGSAQVPVNPQLPSLKDIAGYNSLNPLQKQQQKQLAQSVNQTFPGFPNQQPTGNQTFQGVPGQQPAGNQTFQGMQGQQSTGISSLAPITPTTQPMSITADSLQYLNGFLRTQIGRPVKVDFLIGTNTMLDKAGTLLAVGINYILILEAETDDIVACDFYNIKFIKFYY